MIGYIVKDKYREIYFYIGKPTYDNELKGLRCTLGMINIIGQFPEFNSMSCTDEPIKVEIKLIRI